MFDDMIESFEDQLTYGKMARRYEPLNAEEMVHTRDRVWVPAPMIGSSYDGFDQTNNFDGLTELSVPVSVGFHKSSPKILSAKNLRNKTALANYGEAAKVKLAADINAELRNRVALEGSIFVKRTVPPTGFDDVALANAAMTEVGVPLDDRKYMVGIRAAIGMAANLANRSENTSRSLDAYSKAMINSNVATFGVYQDDQPIRLGAASGGATTVNGANQYWEPAATQDAAGNAAVQGSVGETINRDNRYSQLVVTAANIANVKKGDAFTIAGVNSVHMISKKDTGQLQTFRVIAVNTSNNTLTIAPALISNGGNTIGGREYQNVTATPANGAALTWLNTTTAELNPFFQGSGLLLLPGTFAVDPQDGWNTLRATTPTMGIAITYTRQGAINDLSVKARWDVDFGTALLNPQFAGAEMFNQA